MLNLSDKVSKALTNGKVWVMLMMLIGSFLVIGTYNILFSL